VAPLVVPGHSWPSANFGSVACPSLSSLLPPSPGVRVAVGHPGSRLRWRASFDAQLAANVGAGASLSFYRFGLGPAFTWREHLLTALDLGPLLRRISLGDEITRFALGARWAPSLGGVSTWTRAGR
jgi:hypothetical protein